MLIRLDVRFSDVSSWNGGAVFLILSPHSRGFQRRFFFATSTRGDG